MITVEHEVTLCIETCIECGTPFGIESVLENELHRHGRIFYCPNGHRQHYAESTETKLARAEKELKNERDSRKFFQEQAEMKAVELERARKSLSVTRGQLTKTRKRLQNGVCPCCKRSFTNLSRHMHTQHPSYGIDES